LFQITRPSSCENAAAHGEKHDGKKKSRKNEAKHINLPVASVATTLIDLLHHPPKIPRWVNNHSEFTDVPPTYINNCLSSEGLNNLKISARPYLKTAGFGHLYLDWFLP